jgi:hypothetical protein
MPTQVKTGSALSKFEGDIRAAGQGSIELDELFVALGRQPRTAPDRQDALALYLSADEGWREACAALGGTFAKGTTRATRLPARLTRGEDV